MSSNESDENRDIMQVPQGLNRRDFLKLTGLGALSVGGAVVMTGGLVGALRSFEVLWNNSFINPGRVNQYNQLFPSVSEPAIEEANKTIREVKERIAELADQNDPQGIASLFEQEQFTAAASIRIKNEIIANTKRNDSALYWRFKELVDFTAFAGSLMLSGCGLLIGLAGNLTFEQNYDRIKARLHERQAFSKRSFFFHPQWEETKPTENELRQFYAKVAILPPVGGKIVKGRNNIEKIPPTWTAEEQVSWILKNQRRFGTRFIHQLSVQGCLSDEFKYTAIALIVTSPYHYNWNEPFYEAPWGKIAPLVHDGGNVYTFINPLWSKLGGRTDFLQRIGFVHESQDLSNNDLTFKNATGAALARAERKRLMLETRAYQRLALAYRSVDGWNWKFPKIDSALLFL